MKIAIDISQVIYGTGVSNYTSNLVKHLAKIDTKNEYILFGASLRSINKFERLKESLKENKNFRFKILPIPPTILEIIFNRLRIWPLEKFLGEEVDVFHSSDWTQPKIKSPETKKITTVHDLVIYMFPQSVHPKIADTHKRRLGHVQKEVDKIIADSQATKDDLVKFLKIAEEKIEVVYLAPGEEFHPQDDDKVTEVLAKYKIKKPYILSVATHEPRKNIQALLDVFQNLVKKWPDLHLVLTGKHGWGKEYEFDKNPYFAKGQIISTGFIPNEDLPSLYAGCRVFVYPSLYEGFGLPVLEAMACGAPVVTSNNSSLAEIAKDAAILVDPRNKAQLTKAIEMIFELNLENYQKMVKASLGRARQYSWTKTAKETLKVYEEVKGNDNRD